MWGRGRVFWKRRRSWRCGCWNLRMRRARLSFVVALSLMASGCCWDSSIRETPVLPRLTSLERAERNGTPGVWMNADDAGRLAQWIFDVTGEDGR